MRPSSRTSCRIPRASRCSGDITPEWAWGGSTGRGIKVAVLDSGIKNTHPAVDGAVKGYCRVVEGENGQYTYDESPHTDVFGHGTACAGIIHKIAPEAELYSVQVLKPSGGGSGGAFAAGLQWAIENDMQVCNLSLGTTKRDYLAAAARAGRPGRVQEHHAGHGGEQHAAAELPVDVRVGVLGRLQRGEGPLPLLLQPDAAGGLRRAGHRRAGGVGGA